MSTALTFDQMERRAETTLGVALWAKNAKNNAVAAMWLAVLDQAVKGLVKLVSSKDKLVALSDQQALELAKKLQNVNYQLDFLFHRNRVKELRNNILFSGSLNGLESSAEDLGDIIEDLMLSCDPRFRSTLKDCIQALPLARSADLVGSM